MANNNNFNFLRTLTISHVELCFCEERPVNRNVYIYIFAWFIETSMHSTQLVSVTWNQACKVQP